MSLDVFNAVVKGYADHLFDLQLISVEAGYWSGYFSNSKRPKPLESIMNKMIASRFKSQKQTHAQEVDVEHYLEMERRLNQIRNEVK